MDSLKDIIAQFPVLRLTQREFDALPEYSCTYPTGTTPGKRWKRLDGSHDQAFKRAGGKPMWVIMEFDPKCPDDAKTISIHRYRPIIRVRAGRG